MSEVLETTLVTTLGVIVVAVIGLIGTLIGARVAANDKRNRLALEVEVLNNLEKFPIEQALMREQVRQSITHLRVATSTREAKASMWWKLSANAFFLATTTVLLFLPRWVTIGEWTPLYIQWLVISLVGMLTVWVWSWADLIRAVWNLPLVRRGIARLPWRATGGETDQTQQHRTDAEE